MVDAAARVASGVGGLLAVVFLGAFLLVRLHLAMAVARAEEVEVRDLIAQSDDPVLRLRLVDLYGGH